MVCTSRSDVVQQRRSRMNLLFIAFVHFHLFVGHQCVVALNFVRMMYLHTFSRVTGCASPPAPARWALCWLGPFKTRRAWHTTELHTWGPAEIMH